MTMHLLPIYVNNLNLGRRKQKRKTKSQINHENWLLEQGLHISQISKKNKIDKRWKEKYNEDMKVDRSDYVSAGLSGDASSCAKRGVMVNLHKESPATQKAIMEKAKMTAQAYNKGPIMLISPKEDPTTLGSRSRRG